MSPNTFTQGHVTAVGSHDRAERDIFGVILGVFLVNSGLFVVKEPLCDAGIPS